MPEYNDSNPSPWGLSDDLANRRRCVICHAPKGFDPVAGWCRACGSEPPAEEPAVEAGAATPTDPPNMPEEALRWARAGIAVFPVYEAILGPDVVRCACDNVKCANIGKHPRTANGFHDATTDESQIRAWWTKWPNANIGAPTGNGLFVVDLDGPEAEAWLRERVAEHGPLSATCEITTGRPEGGRHLYFRGDGVKNSSSKIGPKVDARGEGGYVILPPSLHLSGRRYGVSVDAPVADAPGWLLEAALNATSKPKGKPAPSQGDPGPGGGAGESRKRLDGVVRVVEGKIASAPEGTRNDTLNREAFCFGQYLGHYRIDLGEYERRLVNAGIAAGLPASEAEATVCGANGRPGSLAQGYADPKPLPERDRSDDPFAGIAGIAGGGETNNAWPSPVPFRVARTGPDFPVDALPETFASYAAALSTEKDAPVDLACMIMLGMVAGALQAKFYVQRPGHTEPVSLWTCGLAGSSERKSPVYGALKAPIDDLQGEINARDLPVYQAAMEELDALENAIAKERRRVFEKGDDRARLDALLEQHRGVVVPFPPQVCVVSDFTPEVVVPIMAKNGGRLFMGSAEGDKLFSNALGYYNDGKANLDVYLQAYSGEDLRVDRITRAALTVRRAAMSLALATQPVALQGRVTPEARGRGFLARFLFYRPTSRVGFRTERTKPVPDGLAKRYRSAMRALWSVGARRESDGTWLPAAVNLSPEADDAWWAYNVEVEVAQRPGGALADFHDFAGKHAGKVLRIACILHAMEQPSVSPAGRAIGATTMANAIRIGRYALDHLLALEVFDPVAPEVALAERILAWLRDTGRRDFTKRELFDAHRSWFANNADRADAPLRALEAHGYIHALPGDGTKRRRFEVNLAVFDRSP